jgi:hypothetical protein
MSEYIYQSRGEPLANEYGEIHLARAGEIVRCRDCKSYQPGMYKHFTCEVLQRWAKPDDFCAWGERKERNEQ